MSKKPTIEDIVSAIQANDLNLGNTFSPNKGERGQQIEAILGIPTGSSLNDLEDGELKTVTQGQSVSCTMLSHCLPEILDDRLEFKETTLYQKIRQVVFLVFDRNTTLKLASLINEETSPSTYDALQTDYEFVCDAILKTYSEQKQLRTITGPNKLLQIRTKASKPYRNMVYKNRILKNKSMAFYLTAEFVKRLFQITDSKARLYDSNEVVSPSVSLDYSVSVDRLKEDLQNLDNNVGEFAGIQFLSHFKFKSTHFTPIKMKSLFQKHGSKVLDTTSDFAASLLAASSSDIPHIIVSNDIERKSDLEHMNSFLEEFYESKARLFSEHTSSVVWGKASEVDYSKLNYNFALVDDAAILDSVSRNIGDNGVVLMIQGDKFDVLLLSDDRKSLIINTFNGNVKK